MSTIPVEFEELKSSNDLPSPTGVGMRILELTRTDDFSAEDMGDAIMSDPSLTGRILKLANSADKAGHESVTTVSGAIMRLGSQTVRDLALAFSLVSDRQAGACRPFDYERYWSLSLARAVAAQELARVTGKFRPEEAYICGLLAEVGMLALASVHSERYGKLLIATQGRSLKALREGEQAEFDIDHAAVSACMLREWGLPQRIVDAVGAFGNTRSFQRVEPNLESLDNLLRFADSVGSAQMLGETTPARRLHEIGDQLNLLREKLEYDEDRFQGFWSTVAREWRQWGESLEISTQSTRYGEVMAWIAEGSASHVGASISDDDDEAAPSTLETLQFGPGGPPQEPQASASGRQSNHAPEAPPPSKGPTQPATGAHPSSKTAATAADVLDEHAGAESLRQKRTGAANVVESRISILAVDDDPVSLRLLVKHLRNESFEVTMARTGKEGLKRALQEQPALLIVDQEMPGLSGLDVVRALRRSAVGSSIYILLLTGSETSELLVDAFDAGVDDFVTKPFLPRVLTARIKAGVRIAKLQRKVEADRRTIVDQLNEKNALNRKLKTASLTDPLTGLPNRRHAMNRLETEWLATERSKLPFSVIMLDIDHFKSVNDNFGHDVGDLVLQATAQAIKGALRGEDEVCRLGGEEFLVICRGAAEAQCGVVAERIRKAVESNVVDAPGYDRAVTVSLGVAGTHSGMPSLLALLKAADEAVYVAKNSGRNQVQVAGAPTPTPEEVERLRRTA